MSGHSRPPSSAGGKANASSSAKTLNEYQLGDSLGKGAFGQVYRGLNWATGETVAVKEIQMSHLPKAELGEIMAEINLLKNLNHENIVKYKGFVKTRDYLYIILEFCENGSLHSILKKFGKFPESLVAVYICQVLEGLVYLHDQGVIHRDIKGANILTNKDGTVKLADFGVASTTTTGGVSDDTVVGSPYWMAPEVIEQSGATTASDIWSVGCVVIELLEGHPPYHFLDPMPALFRIVQDDCPPIPEGASPIVKDFLYHCFQKDSNLRISAKKLLKHPWMLAARKQLQSGKTKGLAGDTSTSSDGSAGGKPGATAGEGSAGKRPISNYNYDEAVLKVQEWNEALKSPSRPSKHPNRGNQQRPVSPLAARPFGDHLPIPILAASTSGAFTTPTRPMVKDGVPGSVVPGSVWKLGASVANVGVGVSVNGKPPPGIVQPPLSYALRAPEEQTDNWDDDFEEGISFTKLQALEKPAAEEEKQEVEDNAQTIRPSKSPRASVVPLARAPASDMSSIVEDYSDLASEEDESWLEEKVADFKMKNAKPGRRGLFHPDDIKVFGLETTAPGPLSAPLPNSNSGLVALKKKASRSSLTTLNVNLLSASTSGSGSLSSGPSSASSLRGSHSRSSSLGAVLNLNGGGGSSSGGSVSGSFGKAESKKVQNQSQSSEFDKYTEADDEDYEDVFGKLGATTAGPQMQTLQLNTRLSSKSWHGDDSDEEDPFAEIDEGFSEDDLESNLQRDKYARLCTTVNQLIDELTPSAADSQLRNACEQLLTIFNDTPEMQIQFVNSHGMLVILEVLEGRWSRDVTMKLLQIINLLVTTELAFLESFCLIGGIPVMMEFTSKKYPSEYRLEASSFIRLLCHTSVMTLQMFIACRGLKVLVDLLDEDWTEQADLVIGALNGIVNVFELQSPTSKNDFCRMFIREGLLDPLSCALLNVAKPIKSSRFNGSIVKSGSNSAASSTNHTEPSTRFEMKMKLIQIVLIFAQVSQNDIHVRNAIGTRKVVRRLMRACEMLEPECLVQLLKAVKHLSMNATIHEVLQNANALEILIRILDEQGTGPQSTEISNHIFQTCYNLCRLNKSRQEEAAQAGIMPCLKRVIETSSPLRQFALPILCDLAGAGKSCRTLLWQHDGLRMYLKLLEDPYFQVSALESIVSWLQDETSRIEDELTRPTSLESLIRCFVNSKANSFENLLDPFLKITRVSTPVAVCLAKSPPFFKRIIDRLLGRQNANATTGAGANQDSNASQNAKGKHSSNPASNPANSNTGAGKPVVRLNLLRILRTICEVHPNRAVLVERYGLLGVVERLSKYDPAVLVRELAREIIPVLRPGLKPVSAVSSISSNGGGGSLAGFASADTSASGIGTEEDESLADISMTSTVSTTSTATVTSVMPVTIPGIGSGSGSSASILSSAGSGIRAGRLRSATSAGPTLGSAPASVSGSISDRESRGGSESSRSGRKIGVVPAAFAAGGAGGANGVGVGLGIGVSEDGVLKRRNSRGLSVTASGSGVDRGLIGSSSSATPGKIIVPKKVRRTTSDSLAAPIGSKKKSRLGAGGGSSGGAGDGNSALVGAGIGLSGGGSGNGSAITGRQLPSIDTTVPTRPSLASASGSIPTSASITSHRDSISKASRLPQPIPPVPPLPSGMPGGRRPGDAHGHHGHGDESLRGDTSISKAGGGSFISGSGSGNRDQQQQQQAPMQATRFLTRTKARQRLGDIPWQAPTQGPGSVHGHVGSLSEDFSGRLSPRPSSRESGSSGFGVGFERERDRDRDRERDRERERERERLWR